VSTIAVNHAPHTVGYEGSRAWPTGWIENVDAATGKTKRQYHPHPIKEADEAIKRLNEDVRPYYDEMIVLRYQATNEPPFPFAWLDPATTQREYAAALTKISRAYEQQF